MFTELQDPAIDLFMWAMICLGFGIGLLIGYILGYSDGKDSVREGWILKQGLFPWHNKPK